MTDGSLVLKSWPLLVIFAVVSKKCSLNKGTIFCSSENVSDPWFKRGNMIRTMNCCDPLHPYSLDLSLHMWHLFFLLFPSHQHIHKLLKLIHIRWHYASFEAEILAFKMYAITAIWTTWSIVLIPLSAVTHWSLSNGTIIETLMDRECVQDL